MRFARLLLHEYNCSKRTKSTRDPQMVFLTFDDAVTDENHHVYDRVLENRVNPNGCNISVTFYVTHDWANLAHYGTNYQLVNKYFNKGNEIASHSVTYK